MSDSSQDSNHLIRKNIRLVRLDSHLVNRLHLQRKNNNAVSVPELKKLLVVVNDDDFEAICGQFLA